MLTSAFAPLRIAAPRTLGVRAFGGYAQPPLSQGPGGKPGEIPTDEQQATGRTRLELEAFKKGHDYFNRQPVQMQKGQGTFENPVLVPSELDERIVGVVPLVSVAFCLLVLEFSRRFECFNKDFTATDDSEETRHNLSSGVENSRTHVVYII
jgi:hypothetical protein